MEKGRGRGEEGGRGALTAAKAGGEEERSEEGERSIRCGRKAGGERGGRGERRRAGRAKKTVSFCAEDTQNG